MSNYDEKTGIHYGVISPHSINQDALDEIYSDGTDTCYENAREEMLDDFDTFCSDHNIPVDRVNTDSLIDAWSDHYESDGSGVMDYEDKEYTLHISGDNFGIFVILSPYYTFCRQCSPCAPGAGDLNNPVDTTGYDYTESVLTFSKTYCLDASYFDEGKAPYKVYRVDNDQEVV
jgi:hypothetical protein